MDIDLELKVEELIEIIKGRDAGRFEEAVGSIAAIGPSAVELLCLAFRQANEFEATRLADAISAIGGQALPQILRMMSELAGMKKCQAIAALGRINHPDAIDAIKIAFNDPDPGVRLAVLQTVEGAYRMDYDAVIYKALSDKEANIRMFATGIAGSARKAAALDDLITMTHDAEPSVRSIAARAIGKIADPRGSAALAGLLSDPVAIVVSAACIALGEMGVEDNIIAIGPMLSNRSELVRSSAIKALGRLRSSRAITLLERALADDNAEVRELAEKVIKFLKEQGR